MHSWCGACWTIAANFLERRGVFVLIVEQWPKPYDLPRVVHFDGKAMRVFKAVGLAEQVLPHTIVGRALISGYSRT